MDDSRKYIQFNELVIDGFHMLSSADLSGGFKTETQEYSFTHGSYVAFKDRYQIAREQSLSMVLNLDIRKIDSTYHTTYRDHIADNLARPGRLWAIQGNQLLWAWAFVVDFSEAYTIVKNTFSVDVSMNIYEGVWHKADLKKTFLKPHDICNFLENYHISNDGTCALCCDCVPRQRETCPACGADCEFLAKEYAACANKNLFGEFGKLCSAGYQLLYSCEAARRIFGEEDLGFKLCKNDACESLIAGQFYSNTVLDSDGVTVTIKGAMTDPAITINGNTMKINGVYDGTLTIYANGDIYYDADGCEPGKYISPDLLEIPDGSTFGFTAHHGGNGIIVETRDCCTMTCVYVDVDGITT